MSIQENNQDENFNAQQGEQNANQPGPTTGTSPITRDEESDYDEQSNNGNAGGLGNIDEQREGSDADYATDDEGNFGGTDGGDEDMLDDDELNDGEESGLDEDERSGGSVL